MANDEHIAQLQKGVDAWNAWRDENRNIRPNLSRDGTRESLAAGFNFNVEEWVEGDHYDHSTISRLKARHAAEV
jgi:hypothetical protein